MYTAPERNENLDRATGRMMIGKTHHLGMMMKTSESHAKDYNFFSENTELLPSK